MSDLKSYYKKYRGEILISMIVAAVSLVAGILVNLLMKDVSPTLIACVIFGVIIVILLLGLLFNLKKLLIFYFSNLNALFREHSDNLFLQNQYAEREEHFEKEKILLADIFVDKVLPNTIKKILLEYPNLKMLNLIFDSGTTITPIFPRIMKKGIFLEEKKFIIYTNNLAGINEIQKLNPVDCLLKERHFNLIGGQPLSKYRATTGEHTQMFLEAIWENQNKDKELKQENQSKREIITLSVITSNWLLTGEDFKNISICARGEGHFNFKRSVIENSDYLILLAPLGKMLPLNNLTILHDILKDAQDKEYEDYTIPTSKKERTYLLTSFRSTDSLSPLCNVSTRFKDIEKNQNGANYQICKEWPHFEPEGDKFKVTVTELPHQYIRDKFFAVYRYKFSMK